MPSYIITANRLDDGLVVFWTSEGTWTRVLTEAVILDDDSSKPALAAANADYVRAVSVDLVELADVDRRLPVRTRERILFNGPTVGENAVAL